MHSVDPKDFIFKPFFALDKEWAILVGGVENANPMTVSWGGFGTLWSRPVITVYVRPSRHTYRLLNEVPEFTLSLLPASQRSALEICGQISGRDADKWSKAGIHRAPSEKVRVPRVAEARVAFECRTLATFDFSPERFLDSTIASNYPDRSYHRAFIGEVAAVLTE